MVRCVNCGLLALRHGQTNELHEVDAIRREHWKGAHHPSDPPAVQNLNAYALVPVCFAQAIDLGKEVGKPPLDDRVSKAVVKERDCKKFAVWQQGFSPREHQEMIVTERMLKRQRKWDKEDRKHREEQREEDLQREEKRLKDDREYPERQAEKEEDRQKEDRKRNRREGVRFWIMFVVGMTLVPLIAAALQVYGPTVLQNQTGKTSAPLPATSKPDDPKAATTGR